MKPQLSIVHQPFSYEIDKGIPIPPKHHRSKYPFAQMKPGDSFFVPGGKRSTISSAVKDRRKNNPGEEWTYRTKDNGVRVWRVS